MRYSKMIEVRSERKKSHPLNKAVCSKKHLSNVSNQSLYCWEVLQRIYNFTNQEYTFQLSRIHNYNQSKKVKNLLLKKLKNSPESSRKIEAFEELKDRKAVTTNQNQRLSVLQHIVGNKALTQSHLSQGGNPNDTHTIEFVGRN